jgi:tartrate/fumarate subfamily iron-sulfur-dependent hydro-lyase alpha chain
MGISESMITQVGERLYREALIDLPEDVIEKLMEMRDAETSELARFQLDKILLNAQIAGENRAVICQDTGISSYKVKIGTNAKINGDIVKALSRGTALASKNFPTIPHSVHPLTKVNTGDGTGPHTPLVHWDVMPGVDYVEITAQPVGGGGDLCSAIRMFTGSAPSSEVKRFIIETVAEAGCKPCPPMVIGIGLGGMFETVNKLAKDAVMRPINKRHPEKMIADLEEELLTAINELGIGPMGLGGKTTALAVNIEYGNTGTYILPVAIKVGCWAVHRKTARLNNDGTIQYF